MQLKAKLNNEAKMKNVNVNILLRTYMYERFIERLSQSNYKDNFILKGGFYLSNFLGVDKRTTMDIDTAIKNTHFTEENITKMLKEIISIDLEDGVEFELGAITPIRDEDEYGGYRAIINVKIENIKDSFHLDIATGDPITPKEIRYSYKTIIDGKKIRVWAYNIETVLAEKMETVFNRGELNGRLKDFYDIYLIYKTKWETVNLEDFKQAIKRTFEKREYKGDPVEAIRIIRESPNMRERWKAYLRKNKHIEEIDFDRILDSILEILEQIGITEEII